MRRVSPCATWNEQESAHCALMAEAITAIIARNCPMHLIIRFLLYRDREKNSTGWCAWPTTS